MSRCKICDRADKTEIENDIIAGHRASAIARKYSGLTQQNIALHTRHMIPKTDINNTEKLRYLINKALDSDMEPNNITELVRLLEYHDKLNGDKCATCEKKKASPEDMAQAVADYIGFKGEFKDCNLWNYIHIIKEEYSKFIEFLKYCDTQGYDMLICCPQSTYEAFKRFQDGNMEFADLIHGEEKL